MGQTHYQFYPYLKCAVYISAAVLPPLKIHQFDRIITHVDTTGSSPESQEAQYVRYSGPLPKLSKAKTIVVESISTYFDHLDVFVVGEKNMDWNFDIRFCPNTLTEVSKFVMPQLDESPENYVPVRLSNHKNKQDLTKSKDDTNMII